MGISYEKVNQFLERYSSAGIWASVFRKDPSYSGTELTRDLNDNARSLTIDDWENLVSFERFKERFAKEYEALDRECDALTDAQRCVGVLEFVE